MHLDGNCTDVRQMLSDDYEEALEGGKVLLFVRNGIYQARVYKGDRTYLSAASKLKTNETTMHALYGLL